jgi:DHA3 family macrolide efflux protein-like MFS transporter
MGELKELLRIPDFRSLWIAQVISSFGDSLTMTALMFLALKQTGSAAGVAGVMISAALPALLLGLVSGVWVDRLQKRNIMYWSDIARGVLTFGFLLAVRPGQFWIVYPLMFLHASAGTFFQPAKGALLPKVVGPEKLLAANSVGQTTMVIFGLLGTTAAGLLVGLGGQFSPIFVVDALTFFASAYFVFRLVEKGEPIEATGDAGSSVFGELKAGFGELAKSRVLVGLVSGVGVVMLGLGAVNVLLVPFVVEDLAVSETWFGLIQAGQTGGMVLAGVALAALATRLRPKLLLVGGVAVVGVMTLLLASVGTIWQLIVGLFVVGLSVAPVQASASTLLQTTSPPEMLGRIGGTFAAVATGASIGSMAIAGLLAAQFGTRSVFFMAGLLVMSSAVLMVLFFRGTGWAQTLAPGAPPEAIDEESAPADL